MFKFSSNPACTLSKEDAKRWPQLIPEHTEPYFMVRVAGAMGTSNEPPVGKQQWLDITYSSEQATLVPFEPDYHAYVTTLPKEDDEEDFSEDDLNDLPEEITELIEQIDKAQPLIRPEDYVLTGIDFRKDTVSLVYQAKAMLKDNHPFTVEVRHALAQYTAFFNPSMAYLAFLIDIYEGVSKDDPEASIIETYTVTISLDEKEKGIAYVDGEGYDTDSEPDNRWTGTAEFSVTLNPINPQA